MSALVILIPLSLVIALGFLWMFFRASWEGQFDDLRSPAEKVILEEHQEKIRHESES